MKKCNPETDTVENMNQLSNYQKQQSTQERYGAYIGLDVHKDTIAVAIAYPDRGAGEFVGEIANTHKYRG